jgi:phospholipid/cholesterol/gamma-HCH transport system substrate-binding protein
MPRLGLRLDGAFAIRPSRSDVADRGPRLAPLGVRYPPSRFPSIELMARPFAWSDVRGGVIALVAIVVVAVAVLKYSRVGALHGDTVHIYALVGEARGVTPGSEVWLSGQKIGKIVSIDFQPAASADTSSRLLITMQILSRHLDAVHRDALAQIRAGGSVIGAPVVYITPGTSRTTALREGDTVNTHAQADVEGATAQFGTAAKEFPVIMGNVKVLMSELQTTHGTMGAFMNGPGFGELAKVKIRATHVVNRLTGGGTASLVMKGGLTVRAQRVMARADSVQALLNSSNTSLGRFRRDSSLLNDVADIQRELSLLGAELDEPRGTAGRILKDSALAVGVGRAKNEMTLLFADLKKHPTRYISF